MAEFDGFYEGRVVEAELEAIRLRKDPANATAFWLWPPFGPTEERERELTRPKAAVPLQHSSLKSLAAYQSALQNVPSPYLQNMLNAQNAKSHNDLLCLASLFPFLR